MHVKSDFVLRNVMDEYVIVPVGKESLNFGSLITTNEVGAFIWNMLKNETSEEEIITALMKECGTERDVVTPDVAEYLDSLRKIGMLVE